MILFNILLVLGLLGAIETINAVAGTTEIELYSNPNCDTSSKYRSLQVMATTDAGCFQIAQHVMSFQPLFKDTPWGSYGIQYCTDGCGKVNSGPGERSTPVDAPVNDTAVASGRLEKRGMSYLIGLSPENFNGWKYTVKNYKYVVLGCTFLETTGAGLTRAMFSTVRDKLAGGAYSDGFGIWGLELPELLVRWTNPVDGVFNFEPDLAYGIVQDLARGVANWGTSVETLKSGSGVSESQEWNPPHWKLWQHGFVILLLNISFEKYYRELTTVAHSAHLRGKPTDPTHRRGPSPEVNVTNMRP
ncbi:uncharacterized protein TRIVIDRAFT_67389 [Trichoderma virens Gv29-8]|uniref:Uncharacterized protein n=1 Tax=Hypocrea virens (strain Gv29-8 / FGSC 10586) TaxID=413071 RepID=G9N5Z9_HYPVG|nr:uncharacterized protein TRIVIDRAFT_67389 [Trichoderma virens Gv29-8]EHK18190.1 hypothetical protein TRIVIDRAFT_67389 [Trichoderma virens Gv29-8]UKZ53940.1 hypothetical protein TrVGV298_007743 [Trichoderma virens]